MSERNLAYANTPGVAHRESAWINARRTLYGETHEQAKAEIEKQISAKTVIIIEEERG